MNKYISILLLLFLSVFISCQPTHNKVVSATETQVRNETVIALGSCYDETRGKPSIFESVVENKPDVWVWLGDIIYADTHDMQHMREMYDRLKTNAFYVGLRETSKVIGVWDDHDYGVNDGGKFFSKKKESRDILFDFLDILPEDAAYKHKGAYNAHIIKKGNKSVKVMLLDARYFRDTLSAGTDGYSRYDTNEEGDILGDEQWKWLEEELKKNEADVHIIGSGIQIIPTEHPYEKWANFPKARKRLLELIQRTNPNHVAMVSGDRHMSELARIDLKGLSYPLYEFTSSGLTHTWDNNNPEPNQFRIGDKIVKKAFGLIRINWTDSVPKIQIEVRGVENEKYASMPLEFQSK